MRFMIPAIITVVGAAVWVSPLVATEDPVEMAEKRAAEDSLNARPGIGSGEELSEMPDIVAGKGATPRCSGGIVVDDGSFENGIQPSSGNRFTGGVVMRLQPPPGATSIDQVCLCWRRLLTDDFVAHDLIVLDDDGPGGAPGTEIGRFLTSTDGILRSPTWFLYDLSSVELTLPGGPVYIGFARFNSELNDGVYLCLDETGPVKAPMFFTSTGTAWREVTDAIPEASALGVRADFDSATPPPPPAGDCVAGESTLCLRAGRFKVTIEWTDFAGVMGTGKIFPIALDDSGLFYFFGRENLEVLVKVLDGCGLNGHYWVYAAGTTNVAFTLRVEDTESGEVRFYRNPLGEAAPATTDTEAFATCS